MRVLWLLPILLPLHFTCCPTASPAICLFQQQQLQQALGKPGKQVLCKRKRRDMSCWMWTECLTWRGRAACTGWWPRKGSTAWTRADFCSEIQSRSKEMHSSYCKCLRNWISSLHLEIPLIAFHCSCSTRGWGMWLGYVLPRLDHAGSCTGFSRGKPGVTISPRIPNLMVSY